MPHTVSAKKRLRQNAKRRLKNRATKHEIKSYLKKVVVALDAKDSEAATREFRVATKKIDKAAARRILHPNAAARTKSRLATRLASLQTAGK
jgi:small subunit ribosomal protein S20